MHGRNDVEMSRSGKRCIGETRINAPLVSRVITDFKGPKASAAWVHARSLACASNRSRRVGGFISSS